MEAPAVIVTAPETVLVFRGFEKTKERFCSTGMFSLVVFRLSSVAPAYARSSVKDSDGGLDSSHPMTGNNIINMPMPLHAITSRQYLAPPRGGERRKLTKLN